MALETLMEIYEDDFGDNDSFSHGGNVSFRLWEEATGDKRLVNSATHSRGQGLAATKKACSTQYSCL